MAGLAICKHTFNLSDEVLRECRVENPYYQLFCGEAFFRHDLPFDRTSITRWRQRMGEERIATLMQESLSVAVRSGTKRPQDFTRIIIDTTVQPKNDMFPTDARLTHRALTKLVWLARKHVVKYALIAYQRYAYAKQFKRANRALRKLRTYLGRVIRDIVRRVADKAMLREVFAQMLSLAHSVRHQRQKQRGKKTIPRTRPRSSASAKARRTSPMSSA